VVEGSIILDVALRPWATSARRLEKTWRDFVPRVEMSDISNLEGDTARLCRNVRR